MTSEHCLGLGTPLLLLSPPCTQPWGHGVLLPWVPAPSPLGLCMWDSSLLTTLSQLSLSMSPPAQGRPPPNSADPQQTPACPAGPLASLSPCPALWPLAPTHRSAHHVAQAKVEAALFVHGIVQPRQLGQRRPVMGEGVVPQAVIGAVRTCRRPPQRPLVDVGQGPCWSRKVGSSALSPLCAA